MCQSLQVEIKLRSGVVQDCSLLVDGDCKDLSRQVVYDVYLVDNSTSSTPDPVATYNLDFSLLSMGVKLIANSSLTKAGSKISLTATNNCNAMTMMQWSDELFSVNPQDGKVSFTLINTSSGCAPEPFVMQFYQPDPNEKPVRRAKLYEVIVDAYPGETINLVCDQLVYNASSSVFCPSPGNPSGTTIACLGTDDYIVPMPTNTYSPSSGLLRALVEKVDNPNGSIDFVVSLLNLDPSAQKRVNYFDFFTNLTFDQIMQDPTVMSSFLTETIANGNNRTYRLTNENTLLIIPAASSTAAGRITIATINVKGPIVNNLCWNATASLPQDNTARVRTQGSCTGLLALSSTIAVGGKTTNCDLSCAGNDQANVGFAITSEQNFTNCGVTIKLGLTNIGLLAPGFINLGALDLNVLFVTTGTLVLTSFDIGQYSCSPATCASITPSSFNFYYNWGNAPKPLYLDNSPVITLHFTGSGCVSEAIVTRLSLQLKSLTPCVPTISAPNLSQACAPDINGKIWVFGMEPNPPVTDPPTPIGVPSLTSQLEDAIIKIIPENETPTCSIAACSETLVTPVSGKYGACVCPTCSTYIVTPSLNIDQRNGVDPWDLILISKHLLGLEPLNTPYKLIGADSNKSGTVTTFDIVELRKLILGTYPVLPANTSWRFVDKEQVFTNPANPFADVIKESVTGVIPGTSDVDFIGVKIGDVDHSAIAYNRPAFQQDLPFSVGQETVTAKSEFITLPITYQGDQSLEAVQMGLHFDPTYLEFVAPSQGNIEGITPDCFGLQQVKQGNIALLWLYNPISNEHPLQAGDQLCYLTFKVLQPLPENGDWLQLGDQILSSTAWDSQGAIYRPVVPATIAERTASASLSSNKSIQVTAIPNPTHGAVQLQIDGGAGIERAKVGLFDAFGKVVLVRNLRIAPGQQTLDLPELAAQPAGVYNWRIWNEVMQVSGIIVKQ
jgi:hypothetical protein